MGSHLLGRRLVRIVLTGQRLGMLRAVRRARIEHLALAPEPIPAQFLQLRLLGGPLGLARLQQRLVGPILRSPSLPLRGQLLLQRCAAGTVAYRSRRLRCRLSHCYSCSCAVP